MMKKSKIQLSSMAQFLRNFRLNLRFNPGFQQFRIRFNGKVKQNSSINDIIENVIIAVVFTSGFMETIEKSSDIIDKPLATAVKGSVVGAASLVVVGLFPPLIQLLTAGGLVIAGINKTYKIIKPTEIPPETTELTRQRSITSGEKSER